MSFLYPRQRADLGDVTFERNSSVQVDAITVDLGERSHGLAAARSACGEFVFRFHGQDDQAVHDAARALAAVETCPYRPGATPRR